MRLGFGTWGLGGDAYGPIDSNAAVALLRNAFDRGIRFYDTADLYGNGRAEELLGEAFAGFSHVSIATKAGFLHGGKEQDFSPEHIRRSIEASLKRLRRDSIDLFQLHSPKLDVLESDEVRRELETIRASGKAREIGVSVRSPVDAVTAIERHGFRSIQVNFNLIDQRAIDVGLFECARRREIRLIARTPFNFGFLTGKAAVGENDHRRDWATSVLDRWAQAPRYFDRFLSKRSRVELALQYCLAFEEVSVVIPGMMTLAQLDENLSATQGRLDASELAEVRRIYQEHFAAPL